MTHEIDTMTDAETEVASCTFLNGHGDITIAWDEKDDKKMKALIEKKMEEGYQFFIIKPRFFGCIGAKKVPLDSACDLKKNQITLLDKDIETFVKDAKSANLLASQGDANYEVVGYAQSAKEVTRKQTVAVKPVRGG